MEQNERNLLTTARIRNQESGARKRGLKKRWWAANPEIETKPDLSRSICRCCAAFKNATPCLPPPTRARFTPPAGIRNFVDFWYQHPCKRRMATQRERGGTSSSSSSSSSSQLPLKFLCEWEKAATTGGLFEKDNRKT